MNPNPDSIKCPADISHGRSYTSDERDELERIRYATACALTVKANLWTMIHALADVEDSRFVSLHEGVMEEWRDHIDDNIIAALKARRDMVEQGGYNG